MFHLIDNELNVEESHNADSKSQLRRIFHNSLLHGIGNGKWRVDTGAVSGMHAGSLYQLHNAREKYLLPITDRINLHFFSHNIFIHQHRPVHVYFYRRLQIMP